MVLVLAFSVQGMADALTFGTTSRSGDLQTIRVDRDFKVRFTASPRRATIKSGYKQTPADDVDTNIAATTYYLDTGDSGYDSEDQVAYANAHDYDQESLSIRVDNATLEKVRGFDSPIRTPHVMYESTHVEYADASDSEKLPNSGSVELTLNADAREEVTITITGTTDEPSGSVPRTEVFTVYVVAANLDVNANIATFAGLTNENTSADDSDDPKIDDNFTVSGGNVSDHIPMRYKVDGPGRVYVSVGQRRSSTTSTLDTSSEAPVYLDMNGGTNRVTVSTPSVVFDRPAIYIFGRPTLTRTNGLNQEGVASGRLEEYLGVQVKDARQRNVPGLPIVFSVESNNTDAMFLPVPGMLFGPRDTAMTADANTPDQDPPLTVYTDSNGEVKTYYQLGDNEDQKVTAALESRFMVDTEFEPEIGTRARRPTLEIVSGNNQTTDSDGELEDPLVVVVRRDGNRLPGHRVTFVARKGILTGILPDNSTTSSKRVTVVSDGQGEAEVQYDQDPGSGSDTVTASITSDDITPRPAISYEREVVFGINGASGTTPRQPSQPSQPAAGSDTITITLSETTGAPGDEIDVTVDSDPSTVVVIDSGDLDGDDFSREFGTTPFDTVIVLPDEEGEYDLLRYPFRVYFRLSDCNGRV